MTELQTPIVDRAEWRARHRAHLDEEKALTRARDELSAKRRQLPRLEITEPYVFDTPDGPRSLLDLFDGQRQLVIYHFMMGPDWEEGCPSCSFWADNYNGTQVHLAHRDTALVAASRAPLANIETYRNRMGWTFTWVSSENSTFNVDFGVSFGNAPDDRVDNYNFGTQTFDADEAPGVSSFVRDGDRIFLTHQVFSRGLDLFNSAYHLLDLTALGRHEDELPWPMAWLHRHDAYPTSVVDSD